MAFDPSDENQAAQESPDTLRSVAPLVRSIVGICLLIAVGLTLYLHVLGDTSRRSTATPPPPTAIGGSIVAKAEVESLTVAPDQLKQFSAEEARAWNAHIPFAAEREQVVAPFRSPVADPADYGRALDCMTAAIYYEAGNENAAGKLAIAQVILNRVRHPVYPKTVCGVVFEGSDRSSGCQFTFTCDGALAKLPSPAGWAAARTVAQSAMNGLVLATVGAATHYHADYVAPYWADRLAKIAQIGTHIFYRFPGGWSSAGRLANRYLGHEPVVGKMAALTTPVEILVTDEAVSGATPPPLTIETGEVALATNGAVTQPVQPQNPTYGIVIEPALSAPPPPAGAAAPPQNPLTPSTQRPRPRIARPDSW